MSYNLEPLVQILEQILHSQNNHPWILDPEKKPEIESLYKNAYFLKELFENPSPPSGDGIQRLEGKIRDAVHEAENIIESHMAKQILSVPEGQSFTISPPSFLSVIEDLDSFGKEIKQMTNVGINPISESPSSPAVDSSRTKDPNPKKILVGIHEDMLQLKDRLTGQPPKLEIIPIVGMGGIGKTTLARNVYEDPVIVSHFDTRAWVTVSQDYDVQAILLGLLRCVVGELTDEMLKEKTNKLGLRLHQSLWGKRYLLVLDDMWDIEAWHDTRIFFPECNEGSRILITTREMNVAKSTAGSDSTCHEMNLLNEVESWNLFREKVFAQEIYPPIFHEIGKKIANNCRGLPLAIHVVGGFLSQANKTKEYWSQVAEDIATVGANEDEHFSKIFSLSYNNLPNHLKPCFLYLSAFPEDYDIQASRLIRLWVAEGFVKPISGRTPEEAAQFYLIALVDRNLIFVRRQATDGHVKSYGLHDSLRHLCVRKASEDKFLYITNRKVHRVPENTHCLRRLSMQTPSLKLTDLYTSLVFTRSFLVFGRILSALIMSEVIPGLRSLRVFDVMEILFPKFPSEILELVNLRYLAFACDKSDLPHSISALCNLQTLIYKPRMPRTFDVSYKLLGLPQLRHFFFNGIFTLYEFSNRRSPICENLQTLSAVHVSRDLVSSLQAMPNLRKLGIRGSSGIDYGIDLTCLSKLERLKCSSSMLPETRSFLSFVKFPPSLKKLALDYCFIPLGLMGKIATDLPNLEVLKLRTCTLESPTWELAEEEEFSNLKVLLFQNLKLVNWIAEKTHFPKLKCLIIRGCFQLEEIPYEIGDITTLELIELHYSSSTAAESARKIREEQIDCGNEDLQVRISNSSGKQHWF